ncbi:MMPL family transporter [Bermanella marisrubri]|uniref:Membrane protein, putative n=1 Tax=Bermanella marisrubri TaxID=207949 RepID=Q1N6G9_9GAMM|nr:efflux RND transporter permease subunit [Bermanella marisrubri]EAT13623.1 membrane protein, putative [Oceanobacter sp. RED65] [Bermanella marisrubri]QIZ84409.1 MMPL family transporter [Bermanella marisrubri]
MSWLAGLYRNTILSYPKIILALVFLIVGLTLAIGAPRFELDASAESLVLENDQDLANYRMVAERFGSSEFLIVTFEPEWPLFSESSLTLLEALRDELLKVEGIESINSMLDVPLLENPPVPVSELLDNIKTLESPQADIGLAKKELSESPLYKEMLLNLDANITAMQLNLPYDEKHRALTKSRKNLWDKRDEQGLSAKEKQSLALLNQQIEDLNAKNAEKLHQTIVEIRGILENYESKAEIYLGGVPMIADDMITFVENDMYTFGLGVFLFLIITLLIIFRRARWVVIALSACTFTLMTMIGLLGIFEWQVTVISSNFASLLLIMTMSMCIHLIVRYREAHALEPDKSQKELVKTAVDHMFKPCLYMALTTMVAFNSLIFSGIRPVIDFGWMMATGVFMALIIVFILFPVLALLVGKQKEAANVKTHSPITDLFAWVTLQHGKKLIGFNIVLAVLAVLGISKLQVENSFIDYFHEDTEIHQGMIVVDKYLGGTTPMDVIIDFSPANDDSDKKVSSNNASSDSIEEFDDFASDFESDGFGDDFNDGFGASDEDETKYWFTLSKMEQIEAVHRYLDKQPEIGKVTSLATMIDVAESINEAPLGSVELALLYSVIPDEFKALVIDPYASPDHDQARINMRILDSQPDLKRDELLKRIHTGLQEELGLSEDEYMVSGMMVLYNNMLQSLFKSQILTLGAVFVGIMLMFMFLFQSWKLAVIAIVPNLLSAATVLGVMGWAGMPLDMMTITIAAIAIGIAVDDTIHYIHRFKEEFVEHRNYEEAIRRCHASIGKAVYYTSITVIVGFSILALSNFIPTIYFGLLTGLAMLIALVLVLTLLPRMILMFKPLGEEKE